MTEKIERRVLDLPLEVREAPGADGAPGKKQLVGYAAVFGKRSVDLGGFVEEIAPEAFNEILGKTDARALIDHESGKVLGRESAGTLRVSVDATGLRYEVDLPNTSYAADLAESVSRGDIRGSSFGFRVKTDEWTEGAPALRVVRGISHLFDVSPVTFPAYPDTEVALRSLEQHRAEKPAEQPAEPAFDAIEAAHRARLLDLKAIETTTLAPVGAPVAALVPETKKTNKEF